MPRDKAAFDPSQIESLALRADETVFDPGREKAGSNSENEEGNQGRKIAPERELAVLPPENNQKHGRERSDHCFAKQAEHEEKQSQKVREASARFMETQVEKKRAKKEDA